jgi:hypothetical protein
VPSYNDRKGFLYIMEGLLLMKGKASDSYEMRGIWGGEVRVKNYQLEGLV